jgi:hypothetical protein
VLHVAAAHLLCKVYAWACSASNCSVFLQIADKVAQLLLL